MPAEEDNSEESPRCRESRFDLDFTREYEDGTKVPTDFQLRTAWKAVTGIAIAIIAVLLVLLVMVTGKVLGFLQPVLVPLAIAGILAYLLDPVVSFLLGRKVFGKEISRMWAIIIVFSAAVVGFSALAYSIIKPAVNRLPSEEEFAKTTQDIQAWATEKIEWAQELTGKKEVQDQAANPEVIKNAGVWAFNSVKGLLGAVGNFFGFLGYALGFVMVPIYLFFFLKDTHAIRDQWGDYVPLRASPFKDEVVDVLKEINGYLIAFFRGQVLVSIIDGVLVGIALFFVPEMGRYAIIFAVLLAILGIIPFVGFILTLVPAVALAFAHTGSWEVPVVVAVILIVVQQFDGLVIQPRIVGESVGLHPLTVIFSVFLWSLIIGGILGALLAVPLTAAVKVLFRRYIWENRLNSESEENPPAAAA